MNAILLVEMICLFVYSYTGMVSALRANRDPKRISKSPETFRARKAIFSKFDLKQKCIYA